VKKIVLCLIILSPIYAGCGSSTLSGGSAWDDGEDDGQGNESQSVWDDGESHKNPSRRVSIEDDQKKRRKSNTVSAVSPFTHGMDKYMEDLSKQLLPVDQKEDVKAVFEAKRASDDLRFRDYTDVEGLTYGMADSRGISGIKAQELVFDSQGNVKSAFPHRVNKYDDGADWDWLTTDDIQDNTLSTEGTSSTELAGSNLGNKRGSSGRRDSVSKEQVALLNSPDFKKKLGVIAVSNTTCEVIGAIEEGDSDIEELVLEA
jgi:hypothetical protein